MPSQIASIAEAVKDAINNAGSDLSETVTATRVYVPLSDVRNIGDELTVIVVPVGYERTNVSRRATQRDVLIDVGIFQHLAEDANPETDAANDEIDAIVQFAEEVADLIGTGPLASTGAIWLRAEIPDPIYDINRLRENRVMFCRVRFTFRIP